MNILFLTSNDVSPVCGGVERVVFTLADIFSSYLGYACFSAYLSPDISTDNCIFVEKLYVEPHKEKLQLLDFIRKNEINFIISNLLSANDLKMYLPIIHQITLDIKFCRHIFIFHNEPGYELKKISYKTLCQRILYRINISKNLRLLISQSVRLLLSKEKANKILRKKYQFLYNNTDCVILLSNKFILQYQNLIDIKSTKKIEAIPNPLSFSVDYKFDAKNKEKTVLIVSRFEDKQKRISLALKIWNIIEKSGKAKDWTLKIVGHGEDEKLYKKYINKGHLKRVIFFSQQDPAKFYETASVFMMTSAFEGLPVVLLEAIQFGVVPVAFNSFDSLSDIIEDNENGRIIPDNDIHTYANVLINLMENKSIRNEMSVKAIESSKKFSPQNIARQWSHLFDNLSKE